MRQMQCDKYQSPTNLVGYFSINTWWLL